jgi:DNA (cytosine-5)-methyltransferase 1
MGKKKKGLRAAEFFAGIGLMRLGLEKAGWDIVFANDIARTKQKLYANNFRDSYEHFLLEDIHCLSQRNIPDIDLATASFPCTDLSLAGRRAGLQGEQSSAFWGFVNILAEMGERKPPLILLENVAGFLTSNEGEDFRNALLALNKLGYAVDAFIVDAVHFVPQSRVRLFIVGKLNKAFKPKICDKVVASPIRPPKLAQYINDHLEIDWDINLKLPELPFLQTALNSIVDKIPRSGKEWWSEDRVKYLLNQTFDRHLTKIKELQRLGKYTYLTAFRRVRNGKSMAEIRFDGIAGCLRTPKGGSARQILLEVGKGEVNVRLLTPKECARLMGADDFKISGTINEALFGFGDAVCVPVVSWIAENYLNPELKVIESKELPYEKFAESA